MIKFTVDTSNLRRRVRFVERRMPEVRLRAVRVIARVFVHRVMQIARRDTNRYVRGWIEAGNTVGATALPLPQLVPSQWAEEHKRRLRKQIEDWGRVLAAAQERVDTIESRGRDRASGYHPEEKRAINKARKLEQIAERTLDRAAKELAVYEGAEAVGNAPIAIYGRTTERGVKAGTAGPRRRLGITARGKVYGGTGRILDAGDGKTVIEMTNLEAHSNIIEKRHRTARQAMSYARRIGRGESQAVLRAGVRGLWTRAR